MDYKLNLIIFSHYPLKLFQIYIIYSLLSGQLIDNHVNGRRSLGNKKKVVIIGEMADMYDFLSTNNDKESTSPYVDPSEDYDETRWHRYPSRYSKRRGHSSSAQKSVFVPVAAYSVTHSRVPNPHRADSISRTKHFREHPSTMTSAASTPGRTTESAVYGYLNRPEIVEFRGQYFYGPNPAGGPGAPSGAYPMTAASSEQPILAAPMIHGAKNHGKTGIGPGGLLLATLPLVLAPMLSYLFTPMIIPVTATIAAGRRRRDTTNLTRASDELLLTPDEPIMIPLIDLEKQNIPTIKVNQTDQSNKLPKDWINENRTTSNNINEIKVVADFLQKVHFNEKDRDRAMANYLTCDGLLSTIDHCLERLGCEFSDPNNKEAPALDRSVTSIILSHILANSFISIKFKEGLKSAAIFGKKNPGKCYKYKCSKITEPISKAMPRA